jgi:hypothetical protein
LHFLLAFAGVLFDRCGMAKVTNASMKFVDGVVAIRQLDPETMERAYMARHLVQCTLPHSNPGAVKVWSRRNGNLTLGIVPGVNVRTGESYGYPYGTLPRLLLFWMVREATITRSRKLYLGQSLAEFMRDIGLNPDNGTGKRSDARRLRQSMASLFRAHISFDATAHIGSRIGEGWLDMQVAPKGMFWWDEKSVGQGTLWDSWIELGEEFYNAISDGPVPLHLDALRLLKGSSLELDLYAWATYRVSYLKTVQFIPWPTLMEQFGSDYATVNDFQKKASAALRKVKLVYPALKLDFVRGGRMTKGGLRLHPSKTAVPKVLPRAM